MVATILARARYKLISSICLSIAFEQHARKAETVQLRC